MGGEYDSFIDNVIQPAYEKIENPSTLKELRQELRDRMTEILHHRPTRKQLDYATEYVVREYRTQEVVPQEKKPLEQNILNLFGTTVAPIGKREAKEKPQHDEKPSTTEPPKQRQPIAEKKMPTQPKGLHWIFTRATDAIASLWRRLFR